MRISGVNIPENKHIDIALCSVYGVGRKTSQKILKELNIPFTSKVKDTAEQTQTEIRKIVESLNIEGKLKRDVSKNIKRIKDIKCHRGLRHFVHLPVRGQRTKTNARTRKGPKKTMGSGKVKLQKK